MKRAFGMEKSKNLDLMCFIVVENTVTRELKGIKRPLKMKINLDD